MYSEEFGSDRGGAQVRRVPEGEEEPSAAYDAAAAVTGRVDAVGADGIARLQRSAGNAAVAGAVRLSSVRQVVSQPGRGLPAEVRGPLERGFGRSLEHVRLHDDPSALSSARDVQAYAYASGDHIVVPPGAPLETYAEETEHTFQQRGGPVPGTPDGQGHLVSDPSDSMETAARERAREVVAASTGAATAGAVTGTGPAVQRQVDEGVEVQRQVDEPVVQRQAEQELAEEPELEEAG